MKTPSILTCLDDPNLFEPHFRGKSWGTWRVFLAALFGLPMNDAEMAVFQHHTGRATPPGEPFKEAALVVGRRGGKSRVLALVATYLATFFDYMPHLAPGEVATVAVIASDRRQARSIFRFVTGLLHGVPLLTPTVQEETAETITLNNRVVIEIHTASFRVTRGYTFAAVLADETAFWRDDTSANPDVEIFRALRPGLSSIPGAILLNASSPYRKAGLLWKTFARYFGKADGQVLVWRGTTREMNPSLDQGIVDEAFEDDPEAAAAEYGAEFRNDLADFVSRDVVDDCTVHGRHELLPAQGVRYSAFVDPSGGSGDSMTLGIAHASGDAAVLDALRERRPPFSPEGVVTEFAALLRTYRITSVAGDRYAGEWPRERFRLHGISYELSDRPRSDLYRDMLPLLNSGKAELLDNPRLATQLCGLERRTSRSGKDSIDHAPGAHDDLANAAAGALLRVKMGRQPMRISAAAVARFALLLLALLPGAAVAQMGLPAGFAQMSAVVPSNTPFTQCSTAVSSANNTIFSSDNNTSLISKGGC